MGVLLECFCGPAGALFESSVQCFVPVFVVVAVVEELAELDGGGTVAAKLGQFVAVHPNPAFGAIRRVRNVDFSVHILCAHVVGCSKGDPGCSVGLTRAFFSNGFGMRARVRETRAGEHTN